MGLISDLKVLKNRFIFHLTGSYERCIVIQARFWENLVNLR